VRDGCENRCGGRTRGGRHDIVSLRILGAGFGRTGTLSLKIALEELGFAPCYHMLELTKRGDHTAVWMAAARGEAVSWRPLLDEYAAAVDWPVAAFWREISAAYPDVQVILTVRDSSGWYESFRETILAKAQEIAPPRQLPVRRLYDLSRAVIVERTFHGRATELSHAVEVYEAHNRAVIEAVEPRRLLVYDVATGWEPLCGFLGRPVPSKPFPHLNARASFASSYAPRRDS
jgi:hypothetical protein